MWTDTVLSWDSGYSLPKWCIHAEHQPHCARCVGLLSPSGYSNLETVNDKVSVSYFTLLFLIITVSLPSHTLNTTFLFLWENRRKLIILFSLWLIMAMFILWYLLFSFTSPHAQFHFLNPSVGTHFVFVI